MTSIGSPEPEEVTTTAPSIPATWEEVLEPNVDDAEDPFDEDPGFSSNSVSLASSILDYVYENGRRYHAFRKGAYVLPNDEKEQDRLDLLHHVYLLLLDGYLTSVDIDDPHRVLDIGTGTGIWAMDFADHYPTAEVFGVDLSPIQPSWVPPNVKFYVEDVESDWLYKPEEAFDFIHGKNLGGSIRDWDRLMAQCYEHMTPGGWVEFQEPEGKALSDDESLENCPSVRQWQELIFTAAQQFEKEVCIGPTIKQRLLDAGFVDVEEKICKAPIGAWAKDKKLREIGRFEGAHLVAAVEPYTLGFLKTILQWSEEESMVMTAKVTAELRNKKNHLYSRYFFVRGRKPR